MFLLHFYRLYFSLAAGAAVYLLAAPSPFFCIGAVVVVRATWFVVERLWRNLLRDRWFSEHQAAFKELFGPYGIRLINRAENDRSVRRSLAEVFTPDPKKLAENVRNLEAMDAIFRAGIRPDGDAWQLHDLKLKFGKHRLEKLNQ